jgi:hypothetical protein
LFPFFSPLESAQVMAMLSGIGSVLLLRAALLHIGILHTFFGVTFLYLTAALPVLVFLGIEVGVEGVFFFFSAAVFWASVNLFWHDPATTPKTSARRFLDVSALVLALTGAVFSKCSAQVLFAIPFLVPLVRHRGRIRREAICLAAILASLAFAATLPYLYLHNYRAEGRLFPISMEWQRPDTVKAGRAKFVQEPLAVLGHLLRVPEENPAWNKEPIRDSFFNCFWFQIFKRPAFMGPTEKLATFLSAIYLNAFLFLVIAGLLSFLIFRKHRGQEVRDIGIVVLSLSMLFITALIAFTIEYPVYDWITMKAKYVALGLLGITFLSAIVLDDLTRLWPAGNVKAAEIVGLTFVLIFLTLNHAIVIF